MHYIRAAFVDLAPFNLIQAGMMEQDGKGIGIRKDPGLQLNLHTRRLLHDAKMSTKFGERDQNAGEGEQNAREGEPNVRVRWVGWGLDGGGDGGWAKYGGGWA